MAATFKITAQQIDFFNQQGYLVIEDIINADETNAYKKIYDQFLDGTIDTGKNRSDLGDGLGDNKKTENITQIMWPCDFVPELLAMPYHNRTAAVARQILGDDMEMDFDMLINKAPNTNTLTPWHQDAAYWINLPDKRALSCWLALDEAIVNNGCMWYVPGSHLQPLRTHSYAGKKGGALVCEAAESEGICVEVKPGTCILHHGGTLHYSHGNATDTQRRALIINYRPGDMVALERAQGFDHGRNGNAGERVIRNNDLKN
jgi:phytanoyl-CoA hydroxylase